MAINDLSAQRLRELLDYDARTGIFTWRVARGRCAKPGDVAGARHHTGYLFITVDGRQIGAHRLAWLHTHGVWPVEQIDHVNGKRSDSRIENLRDVSRAANKQNVKRARSDSKASGLLGAYWHSQSKKWFSNIGTGGRRVHLGMFETAQEAHQAYIEAKRRFHPGCTI